MSYARFCDGDVYVYCDGKRWIIHVRGKPNDPILCSTRCGARDELLGLRERGFIIPQKAIDRLEKEIKNAETV